MRRELVYLSLFVILLTACTNTTENQECTDLSGSEKDDCYARLAIQTGNDLPNICAKIENKQKMNDCLVGLMEWKYQPYSCNMFETQAGKDECYMIIGANMKLVDKCDNIVNPEMKDYCYFENVKFFDLAKEICSKISSEELKTECDSVLNKRG